MTSRAHQRYHRNTSGIIGRVLFDDTYKRQRREMRRLDFAVRLMLLAFVAMFAALAFNSRDALIVAVGCMLLAAGVALYNFFRERGR